MKVDEVLTVKAPQEQIVQEAEGGEYQQEYSQGPIPQDMPQGEIPQTDGGVDEEEEFDYSDFELEDEDI